MSLAAVALATAFALSSPAFPGGGTIPTRYTCDGKGVSPPLRWTAPPRGTRTLSLLVADPDAPGGTFVHWRATRIPARAGSIGAGGHFAHELGNSAGTRGWTPPCPPRGSRHRYRFVLKALDARSRVLGVADLVGRYGR